MSNSSPMPVPSAVIIACTSLLASTRSSRAFSTLRILPRIGRIAWCRGSRPLLGRAAGRVALDDEDLALAPGRSTGSRSACRAGRRRLEQALASRARSRALRGRHAAPPTPGHALRTISLPSPGLRSNQSPSRSFIDPLHERLGLGVAQLGLGLALELRLAQLDEMTAVRPSRTSSPVRFVVLVLEHAPARARTC